MSEFYPGARVRLRRNINKIGTLISQIDEDNWIVKWDNNNEFDDVRETKIEVAPGPETPLTLLKKFRFAGLKDLRFAITLNRLSGKLSDFIYSLNLTNTSFYPYQFKPLITFLNSQSRSLLIADEVGLGKTIEAGLIWTELEMRKRANKLLVICPAALREKWKFELNDKFNLRATIRNANELFEEMKRIEAEPASSSVSIISLQGARNTKSRDNSLNQYLRGMMYEASAPRFDLVILDEAHSIRNQDTSSFEFVENIQKFTPSMLMLSATPIQTSQSNLFSLMGLLAPEQYPTPDRLDAVIRENERLIKICGHLSKGNFSVSNFRNEVQQLIYESDGSRQTRLEGILNQANLEKILTTESGRVKIINDLLSLDLLFRTVSRMRKADVIEDRVIREVFTYKAKKTAAETEFYNLVSSTVENYAGDPKLAKFLLANVLKMFSSSAQAVFQHWNRTAEVDVGDEEYESYLPSESVRIEEDGKRSGLAHALYSATLKFEKKTELFAKDSKLEELIRALELFWEHHPNEKVLLFSFYKITLRYLEKGLKKRGINAVRYDGDIPSGERPKVMEEFRSGNCKVLLASEIAAEGIDLQFMRCVVNFDMPWNPSRIEQRIGRIDRIGQKSPKIFILNLLYANTIDELVYERLLDRLNIFRQALGLCEDVIGAEIAELTPKLFEPNLTKEQIEERINQTKIAIEQKIAITPPNELSLVYKLIQKEIAKAQELEKFVTAEDLISYIRMFLEAEGSGGRLIEIDSSKKLYRLDMTSQIRVKFESFLNKVRCSQKTGLIVCEPPPLLRIENKKGPSESGVERVTQNHPLITFISHWLQEEKIAPAGTAAIRLSFSTLPDSVSQKVKKGLYYFLIEKWTKSDISDSSFLLKNFIFDLENSQLLDGETGDRLIHLASLNGEDLPTALFDKEVKEGVVRLYNISLDLTEGSFDDYEKRERENYLMQIDFALKQLSLEEQKVKGRFEERYQNTKYSSEQGMEGRLKIVENEFKKEMKNIEDNRARTLANKDSFEVSNKVLQVGLLEII